MRMRRFAFLLIPALALWTQCASAFLDPPYITPANPAAGEAIFVNIYGGQCDLVDDGMFWPPPVTREGNAVTILFTGSHEEDPEFCYFGVATRAYPLGSYPPGTYVLHVERRYTSLFGWIHETLGIIPFTVTGSPRLPIETPALSRATLASLLLTLLATALLTLRTRRIQLH